MERRNFLELVGAMLTGMAAAEQATQAQTVKKQILVIGAGMSGLAAAQALQAPPRCVPVLPVTGLPAGLAELPFAGRLFGVQTDRRTKTELVLLITPRVIREEHYGIK